LDEHTYARASRLDIQYYGNTGPALARRKVKTIPHDNKSGNVFQPERYEILRCMRQDTRVTREQDMLTCGNGARFYFLAATSITPPPPSPPPLALRVPTLARLSLASENREASSAKAPFRRLSPPAFSRARNRALKRTREKSPFRDTPTIEKWQSLRACRFYSLIPYASSRSIDVYRGIRRR